MGDLIKIKFNKAVEIQDLNCDAIASIIRENKLLYAIEEALFDLDRKDGILGNDTLLNQARKVLQEAIKQNKFHHQKDTAEKKVLDNVIPLFSEHIPDEAA